MNDAGEWWKREQRLVALSDWLRRCRSLGGGSQKGQKFGKLLEVLVGSVLLYGVEVWGCGRQLKPIEEVQMRAVRLFMGVGRLHPLAWLPCSSK